MGAPNEDDLWADLRPEAARRLLLAGLACFSEVGFHATTTRDISRRAGMSAAAMYLHFPSKAELLRRIALTGHEAAWAAVEAALRAETGPRERLAALTRTFTGFHARHHDVARVAQHEMRSLDPQALEEVRAVRRRFQPLVEAEIEAGIAAGIFAVDDVPGVARSILSLGIDVSRWYDPAGAQSPDDVAALHAALALRMTGAEPGAGR